VVTATACTQHSWETFYDPYERVRCAFCGYTPFATIPGPQRDFVVSEAPYPGYFAGRGAGKSIAGLIKLIHYATRNPGALLFATQPTNDGFEQNVLPAMREIWRDGEGSEWAFKEKKGQIVFPRLNVTVLLLSAEATIPGIGASFAAGWMDEIGIGNQRDLFLSLQPAMRQKGYDHQIWVTSTPKVTYPWIKQIWVEHIHPLTRRELASWQGRYPTFHAHTKDNPWLPEEIKSQLLSEWEGSRWAAQELAGEFITVEGVAFPEFSRQIHVRAFDGRPTARRVVGIDFGQARPTALVEIVQDEGKKLWVVDSFYKRNAIEDDWVQWCADRKITKLVCDPTASEEQLIFWRGKYNIYMTPAKSNRRDERYKFWSQNIAVKDDGRPNIYIDPKNEDLIAELENLAHAVTRGRNEPEDKWVPGSNDHAYDAGAYAGMEFEGYYGTPHAPFALGRIIRRR